MITLAPAVLAALNLNALTLFPEHGDPRTRLALGRVSFRNAHYTIDITAGGSLQITRLDNQAKFLALGLPADPDGPMFDFFGFATLLLHDGTQLTVHTAARDAAAEPTRPDGVEIVSGGYRVAVQGLGSMSDGALRFVESMHEPAAGEVSKDDAAPLAWRPLDPQADAQILAHLGPLAGPQGAALLDDGVLSITFMGSFQGAPAYHLRDPDDTSGTGAEQRRLRDHDAAVWRLSLARPGGQPRLCVGVPAPAAVPAGVHPSWGLPAFAATAIES